MFIPARKTPPREPKAKIKMKIINNFFIDVFYSYQAEPVSRQNTDSMLNNCNKLLTKPYAENGLFFLL
ncbi:hypothetical protein AYY17_04160 [Morganella psychrotolerans]|uniref:Uncharacterized protein n=1 Tax=Morganella psychrotolerans TaxID=368603 RepID=A0A1B8HDR9_9GAMM|nr:hypothetical protein AYY17_04160 [Morganella psychrotolerans]